ncbi:hypothetical protein HPB48_001214 [Haemaphysalis longicornis]|uniref:Uncharacterized protein n=1 Tax=Haemaphysalis longicornis TaxID=44386 RepID=A0A9J6FJZ3_HAELO|nr:hypothetical protein HPB48_001214 [Haemaphysalis longicornis]
MRITCRKRSFLGILTALNLKRALASRLSWVRAELMKGSRLHNHHFEPVGKISHEDARRLWHQETSSLFLQKKGVKKSGHWHKFVPDEEADMLLDVSREKAPDYWNKQDVFCAANNLSEGVLNHRRALVDEPALIKAPKMGGLSFDSGVAALPTV